MMRLTMLGTGNALVTKCYNTCFLLEEPGVGRHGRLLVDGGGGNGLLTQLQRVAVPWQDVRQIFVTHTHMDHIMGIFWIIRMICQFMNEGSYEGDATIYAHDEVLSTLRAVPRMLLQPAQYRFIDDRLHLVTVHDGETLEIAGRPTRVFDVGSTKTKQFGFKMTLPCGGSLVCCGDEPLHESRYPIAQGAQWLLHEAFCLKSQAEQFHAYKRGHSTVYDACTTAEKLGVSHLVLYHTEDSCLDLRKKLYAREGQQVFHGSLYIPNDLETIELT